MIKNYRQRSPSLFEFTYNKKNTGNRDINCLISLLLSFLKNPNHFFYTRTQSLFRSRSSSLNFFLSESCTQAVNDGMLYVLVDWNVPHFSKLGCWSYSRGSRNRSCCVLLLLLLPSIIEKACVCVCVLLSLPSYWRWRWRWAFFRQTRILASA